MSILNIQYLSRTYEFIEFNTASNDDLSIYQI
jgi:hypothetical protein